MNLVKGVLEDQGIKQVGSIKNLGGVTTSLTDMSKIELSQDSKFCLKELKF